MNNNEIQQEDLCKNSKLLAMCYSPAMFAQLHSTNISQVVQFMGRIAYLPGVVMHTQKRRRGRPFKHCEPENYDKNKMHMAVRAEAKKKALRELHRLQVSTSSRWERIKDELHLIEDQGACLLEVIGYSFNPAQMWDYIEFAAQHIKGWKISELRKELRKRIREDNNLFKGVK